MNIKTLYNISLRSINPLNANLRFKTILINKSQLLLKALYLEATLTFLRFAAKHCSVAEAPLGVFGIRDIRGKNCRDTGYLRKKLLGYRIFRSSFRDTGYSQKIVTYQMFDEKRSWITKYMPFSVFLLMIR